MSYEVRYFILWACLAWVGCLAAIIATTAAIATGAGDTVAGDMVIVLFYACLGSCGALWLAYHAGQKSMRQSP